MKKRLCIIGFGGMGYGFHYHQTVDHDLIELAGIYDIAESRVEKAKKNRHTATNIAPKSLPKTVPKAVWARLVLPRPSGMTPFARTPSEVYRVEIITRAFRVSTINVSINTPTIATTP